MNNVAKNFDILVTNLNVLYSYFDGPTKFFSDVDLAKFLDTLAKLIFSCFSNKHNRKYYYFKKFKIIFETICSETF